MTSVTVKICIIRFKETYIIFSPKQQFFKLVNSGLKYQFSGFLSSLFLSKASASRGLRPLAPPPGLCSWTPLGAAPPDPCLFSDFLEVTLWHPCYCGRGIPIIHPLLPRSLESNPGTVELGGVMGIQK